MKALLIDPYQKKIHSLEIEPGIENWYDLLRCTMLDHAVIQINREGTRAVDIWVDDEGLLREPVPPRFKVSSLEQPLAGYGLILGANLETGDSIDCPMSAKELGRTLYFEAWEKRLDPKDYFDELTRVPSWETV